MIRERIGMARLVEPAKTCVCFGGAGLVPAVRRAIHFDRRYRATREAKEQRHV